MKKGAVLIATALLVSLAFVSLCLAFEAPVITLERVEVASIQPYFVKPRVEYKNEKEPGKDLASRRYPEHGIHFQLSKTLIKSRSCWMN